MKNEKAKELIKELIKSGEFSTYAEFREVLKEMSREFLNDSLEVELTQSLGYDKYEHEKEIKNNYRNGYSSKKVKTHEGEMKIKIPRDRNGQFEPQIIQKYQKDISELDHKIITMYAKGMSTRDIEDTIKDIYGIDVDSTLISKITDKILPKITEWVNRPLDKVYTMIFIDGIRFKVKENNQIKEKSVYIVMGYTMEGIKDVLGFWLSESESSKYWLTVLNELKSRGLEDILIISCDNLKGISEAIKTAYPKTEIQKCVVHQIRNSVAFVRYDDLKEFTEDMKKIYTANSIGAAEKALDNFEQNWSKKYGYAVKQWKNNFDELLTFFNFPKEIRKLIYTTNVIENLNRNIRKISKNKNSFPTDNSLTKVVYLAINEQLKKWTTRVPNWGLVLNQLMILFEDRLSK